MKQPFDAVLVIAFGGPQGTADVRPFLENVLRGRRVSPGRIDEVAHHYELFGGISPLTALTRRQAEALRDALAGAGAPLPVYVGMRNWHPYLADTLAEMARAGVRRAIGLIAAAHRSYSSCTQYKENVAAAREGLAGGQLGPIDVTYVGDWHTDAGFVGANAAHVAHALARLPAGLQDRAEIVFTAHSIPVSMADRYPYQAQFEETARRIAAQVNAARAPRPALPYATVYQSRSGRPEDPWLGPDVCDYLRESRARGLEAAVLCPAGFLVDHIEVLYDLDTEALAVAQAIGLPMTRATTVGDAPQFVATWADVVMTTVRRYERGWSLPIVPSVPPGPTGRPGSSQQS